MVKVINVLEKANEDGEALTFNDIRLKTGYSDILPVDVNLESKFSRNVPLKIPIVSAPMDTVTEYELARGLAILGGLGILHRNLSPEDQQFHVHKVKYHLHGFIREPVCVKGDRTIQSILLEKEKQKYGFDSFPVLDSNGRLVGLLTGNDFMFCDDLSSAAGEIMTKEVITARTETNIEEAYRIMKEKKKKVLPLIDDDRKVTGLYTFKDLKRIISGESNMYNTDVRGQLRVGAAIGVGNDAFNRLELLVKANVDVVVIDTSHGDTKSVIDTLIEIKSKYPDLDVVVGNISEADSAMRLIKAGADGLRVGQGGGSICTTRVVTGTGCPQVTAIYNCVKPAEEAEIPVCADGGLQYSGDIAVAIGVGAHSVMMGNMLAGTRESPGEEIFDEGKTWKEYRGMGSEEAMLTGEGSRERYLQGGDVRGKFVPEGVSGRVELKGSLKQVIHQYVGGLRHSMGLQGARNINELREKADFWRITHSGDIESHPHNVRITRDPPNYQPLQK